MATLNVCSRISASSGPKRFQITIQSLEQQTKCLSEEISRYLETDVDNYDIIYAGQVLKPDVILSQASIHNLSTVYVVNKFTNKNNSEKGDAVPAASKSEVLMAMQSALLKLEYRNIVERMLSDPDSVENIIATTPGLDKDPAVLAMLQEPELVAVLASPQNMDSLLKLHPSFGPAAITIATAVNEETAKSGAGGTSAGLSYSLDQMSDEDDDDNETLRRARAGVPRGGASQSITASQLAAALQAATGASTSGVSPPGAVMPSTSQRPGASGSGTSISSDFFQQAMAHAQNASSDAAVQQLIEMGVAGENQARQALAIVGGDIQAAIELIFNDDDAME